MKSTPNIEALTDLSLALSQLVEKRLVVHADRWQFEHDLGVCRSFVDDAQVADAATVYLTRTLPDEQGLPHEAIVAANHVRAEPGAWRQLTGGSQALCILDNLKRDGVDLKGLLQDMSGASVLLGASTPEVRCGCGRIDGTSPVFPPPARDERNEAGRSGSAV